MECAVLYGSGGCLSISIPSGNVKSTIKGGRSCYINGFIELNGAYYASCNEKAVIDVISNGEIRTIALPELCPVLKSMSCSILVAGSETGKVFFWNTVNGALIKTFKPHSKPITCIDFDKSYNTLLTGSMDSSMKLYCQPLLDCNEVAIFYGHLAPIINCINLINHKFKFNIASIAEDSTLKLWKLQKNVNKKAGLCIHTINLNAKPIYMLKGLGNCLYVPLNNSTLFKLDLQSNCESINDNYYNFTQCVKICQSCEGYHLISVGNDGIRIWDSHSITCLTHLHIGSDCNSILMSRPTKSSVTKTPLKVTELSESFITLLQNDKESVKTNANKCQDLLKKILPKQQIVHNLDLTTHLNLYKDSQHLYKLIELQVAETAKQMESIDEFNRIYKDTI